MRSLRTYRVILVLVAAALVGLAGAVWLAVEPPPLPSYSEVIDKYSVSDGIVFDRSGRPLHQLRIREEGRRLEWTTLDKISPALQTAVIQAEDRRFYQHRGVDWMSLFAAAWGNVWSGEIRGASTITMQLSSLVNSRLGPAGGRRSILQKLRQIRAARSIEKRGWTKQQILESYLNLVSFRGELQGIKAASRGLFGKEAHGITADEALVLAVLLRSPNSGLDQVVSRAERLARQLGWQDRENRIRASAERAVSGLYYVSPVADYAPHVARKLLRKKDGAKLEVTSTIDLDLQLYAAERVRNRLFSLRSQNVHDAALLVLDNKTGDTLAYLGNDGARTTARFVDGTQAQRQAGSILKPFLYALAFDRQFLTPASLLDDSPVEIPVVGGVYRPQNYDNRFRGLVTARQALASSLNVPAVRVLNLVGVEQFVTTLRDLGFKDLQPPDYYGPSLALGSADVCLQDLVDAYRALANGGMYQPSRLTLDPVDRTSRRIFSPEASYLVADVLSDRESRELTFGLENVLATRYWSAVKTGTSKDMRDNWCVGFSEHYTVGVWVGNFSGAPMWSVSGVSGAAPLWLEIMNYLHRDRPSRQPPPPSGLRLRKTNFPDLQVNREELYIRGTESETIEAVAVNAGQRIVYPVDGMILALDPDVPASRQIVVFEAEAGEGVQWKLNGKELSERAAAVKWQPKVGKHQLVLETLDGRPLETVGFEVR
ncbi:MAG TPA: penicillin-binding protein 1C [Acidobacteriota bacterium]|nr:penicillin-binding protein 1C [Acidobacteriota bacterium]